MNTLKAVARRFAVSICFNLAVLASVTSHADGALVILDGFETGVGHFGSNPNTGSGTSQGFIKLAPDLATSTIISTDFFTGLAAQRITLVDDVNAGGVPTNPVDSWRLRHLSGGGNVASNVALVVEAGGSSYVGYWLKTSSAGFEAGIGIDDGLALEIGRWQPVIADGQWHLYEWRFQDEADWNAFAGTGSNGAIDNASVTIDSLFFRGGFGTPLGTSFNADFVLDDISYNQTGSVVPEPSAAMLLLLGGIGSLGIRRRSK